MPINYKNYPSDWKDVIRPHILKRDNYRCRHCGISNRVPYVLEGKRPLFLNDGFLVLYAKRFNMKIKYSVLTIAHLNHNVKDNSDSNLLTLCTRCHLKNDGKHHAMSRKLNKSNK